MQSRRDAREEGYRKGGMKKRRDSGLEGYVTKGRMQ